jgi:hypothetical protein
MSEDGAADDKPSTAADDDGKEVGQSPWVTGLKKMFR